MNQKMWAAAVGFVLGALNIGCQSGGIGDPCIPEDEYQMFFGGYSETEVNLESRSFQCETRLCLVNHFKGRVTCPYGQLEEGMDNRPEEQRCHVPGSTGSANQIKVPVNKQLTGRTPADTVYCSCRCAGPDANSRYCKCPTGFQCEPLLPFVPPLGNKELAGSYCIKDGTDYEEGVTPKGESCTPNNPEAQPPETPGDCGYYYGPY